MFNNLFIMRPGMLASTLNSITEGKPMLPDILRAYSSPFPNEGKDLTQCGSYLPIALLNADLKLFAKILSNRLLLHTPCLIHRDQRGFVPLREPQNIIIHAA